MNECQRRRVAFVTNISPDSFSGGFSAMNRAMFELLSGECLVDYLGPVDPKASLRQHLLSKARRMIGLRGDFFFFSKSRLEAIRREVEARLKLCRAEFVVFHGFTPWIHTRPGLPYLAWNDCSFWQYVHINFDPRHFRTSDLERIKQREASWLRSAQRVIFRSAWAAEESIHDYGLDRDRVGVVGNYGFATPPTGDAYEDGQDFLLIATDFKKKGGPAAVEAFRQVQSRFPNSKLIVVGQNPGRPAVEVPGVVYLGSIDKSDPKQKNLLEQTFARARCLLHPTTADTNPMVLIEAGYFGCPAISTRRYAIPELVVDGVSGLLLDDPTDVTTLTNHMIWMLQPGERYQQMRRQARTHMLGYYTREAFQRRLTAEISRVLCNP